MEHLGKAMGRWKRFGEMRHLIELIYNAFTSLNFYPTFGFLVRDTIFRSAGV